jgi:uncharacterized repeat protein (TIGR01451 family)
MRRSHHIAVLLIVLAALSQSACAPIPACDPDSSEFDLFACRAFLANLTCLFTYGSLDYCQSLPPTETFSCAPDLVCQAPDCLWLEENGSFEVDSANAQPLRWTGDAMATTIDPSCHDAQSLDLLATTPEGASASTSAQVYQVIDLGVRVPEARRDELRRVRAQASFTIQDLDATDDRRFGLRLDAYAGDPAAFPREGDPETIPATTDRYRRVASATDAFVYAADGERWQAATAALMLPDDADFVVVSVEHEEDVQNDTEGAEFEGHSVDYVQVALDGGNAPPVARPNFRSMDEDATATIDVLGNDADATSRLDEGALVIATPPASGIAEVLTAGFVRYTPAPDFNGTDTFTYTVADEEGLVSNEALVTVTVRPVNDPPVAADDTYEIPESGTLTVTASDGVLANDTDVDGDPLTAVLRTVDDAALTLDLAPSGAFTATVPDDYDDVATFTYRARDADTTSGITLVTLTRPASGYDLALDKTATPTTVGPSAEATFTVDVTNNGPGMASDVVVTDQVPDFETTVQSTAATQGSYDLDSGVWTVGELAAGQTATLTITALIHLTVTNAAFITDGLDEDTTPDNNSDEVVVTVIE